MEQFASLFVSIILLANAASPTSNLPQVLGIETEGREIKKEVVKRENIKTVKDIFRSEKYEVKDLNLKDSERKREEFANNIQKVSDERKRNALVNIDRNLNNINDKRVEQLRKIISRLSEMVTKLEKRINSDQSEGIDATEALTLLESAKEIIEEIKTLTDQQSSKEYLINVENEDNLKESALSIKTMLKEDIGNIEAKIKEVKNLLKSVITELESNKQ